MSGSEAGQGGFAGARGTTAGAEVEEGAGMFFIAGLTTRTKTVDAGEFFCPNEQGLRRYQHLQLRRWFTFFFIPVIPLGQQGEWVQCDSCGTTYDPSVRSQYQAQRLFAAQGP